MYYISLKLDINCPTELRKQLMERGFSMAVVGKHTLKRTVITSPNVLPLSGETSQLECIANLKGDCNFPDLDTLKFLYAHRSDFKEYLIGPLPF